MLISNNVLSILEGGRDSQRSRTSIWSLQELSIYLGAARYVVRKLQNIGRVGTAELVLDAMNDGEPSSQVTQPPKGAALLNTCLNK